MYKVHEIIKGASKSFLDYTIAGEGWRSKSWPSLAVSSERQVGTMYMQGQGHGDRLETRSTLRSEWWKWFSFSFCLASVRLFLIVWSKVTNFGWFSSKVLIVRLKYAYFYVLIHHETIGHWPHFSKINRTSVRKYGKTIGQLRTNVRCPTSIWSPDIIFAPRT